MTTNQRMLAMVAREIIRSINGISDYEKGSDEYNDCLRCLAQPEDELVKELMNETFKECTNRFGKNLKFVGNEWLSDYIRNYLKEDNLEQYRK